MTHDRTADIPIRHRFRNYVCTIGYSERNEKFGFVAARMEKPPTVSNASLGFDGETLYIRIMKDPARWATVLEILTPDAKEKIFDLREKAISERGKGYGFALGFVAFLVAAYGLDKLHTILSGLLSSETADLVLFLPALFGFLIVPIVMFSFSWWYQRWYRNHCTHVVDAYKDNRGNEVVRCKRCGLTINRTDTKNTA